MSESKNRAKQLAAAVMHKLKCVDDTDDPSYRAMYATDAAMLCAAMAEQLRFEEGVAVGKAQAKRKKVTRG